MSDTAINITIKINKSEYQAIERISKVLKIVLDKLWLPHILKDGLGLQ